MLRTVTGAVCAGKDSHITAQGADVYYLIHLTPPLTLTIKPFSQQTASLIESQLQHLEFSNFHYIILDFRTTPVLQNAAVS